MALAVLAPSAEARGLRLGFFDDAFRAPPAERDPWLDRAVTLGSEVIRARVGWRNVAPRQPTQPADPADPAYQWDALDTVVRGADARGVDLILDTTGAPDWAEGPGRRPGALPGTWLPQARAYGAFARALATRYSGSYPDPGRPGETLPRVSSYLPWNEPNLSHYLEPQWVKRGGRFRIASPAIYRSLLNAFARGVKSVNRHNLVVAGVTAPFGDYNAGGSRLPPARFVRALLRRRTTFDVLAHHPYATGGPLARALNRDDVSISDMKRLTRPLRRAQRAGRISPRGRKRLWVTEMSWDSSPPDPQGVPAARHARWLQEAFFVLFRSGVDTITWFQIRDAPPTPSYSATYQSGVFLADGTPKPAAQAFAFPLVVKRSSRKSVRAWTRAPVSGELVFELARGGSWRTIASVRVRRHQVLVRRLPGVGSGEVRARMGASTSLPSRP